MKFLAEDESSMSYSLFCLETCMCKLHENRGFVVQRLYHLEVISTINLKDLVKAITCDREI